MHILIIFKSQEGRSMIRENLQDRQDRHKPEMTDRHFYRQNRFDCKYGCSPNHNNNTTKIHKPWDQFQKCTHYPEMDTFLRKWTHSLKWTMKLTRTPLPAAGQVRNRNGQVQSVQFWGCEQKYNLAQMKFTFTPNYSYLQIFHNTGISWQGIGRGVILPFTFTEQN